jgi:hypothetical protein
MLLASLKKKAKWERRNEGENIQRRISVKAA